METENRFKKYSNGFNLPPPSKKNSLCFPSGGFFISVFHHSVFHEGGNLILFSTRGVWPGKYLSVFRALYRPVGKNIPSGFRQNIPIV